MVSDSQFVCNALLWRFCGIVHQSIPSLPPSLPSPTPSLLPLPPPPTFSLPHSVCEYVCMYLCVCVCTLMVHSPPSLLHHPPSILSPLSFYPSFFLSSFLILGHEYYLYMLVDSKWNHDISLEWFTLAMCLDTCGHCYHVSHVNVPNRSMYICGTWMWVFVCLCVCTLSSLPSPSTPTLLLSWTMEYIKGMKEEVGQVKEG